MKPNRKEVRKTLDIRSRQMLGEVIEANLDYLVRFATLRIGSKSDAEDVVYEAVRRLLERDLSKIRHNSVKMYLFRIVYNLCKDFYMSCRDTRPLSAEDEGIPEPPGEYGPDLEEIARLNGLLDSLPEREAEIIRMKTMDELSFVEISQILSTPASTVKSRFRSGMDKLKKQYLKNQ